MNSGQSHGQHLGIPNIPALLHNIKWHCRHRDLGFLHQRKRGIYGHYMLYGAHICCVLWKVVIIVVII